MAAALATAEAQVQSIGLEKLRDYTQTSSSTPSGGTLSREYLGRRQRAREHVRLPRVEPLSLIGSGPLSSSFFGPYSSIAFNSENGEPALPNGTYTFAIGSSLATLNSTASVSLTGDFYTSVIPKVSGSGLTWSNGHLLVDAGTTTQFDFNTAASFASSGYALNSVTANGGGVSFLIRDSHGQSVVGFGYTALLGNGGSDGGEVTTGLNSIPPHS